MNIKIRKNIKNLMALLLVVVLAVSMAGGLAGCGRNTGTTRVPGSSITPAPSKAISELATNNANEIVFTGVLTYLSNSEMKMHFIDTASGTEYEISYTGGTDIQNSYGTIKAASTMELGEIYDLTCDKTGKASKIYGSKNAWERSEITGMEFNEIERSITLGNKAFKYESYTVIFSDAERISIAEIVAQDKVTVRGIDNKVYSVNVDNGHGYISLSGVDSFVGGYLSIGRNQLLPVSHNMLVTAPVGTYMINLQKGSLAGSKTVTVKKNEQTEISFEEYTTEAVRMGVIRFMVTPSNAIMTIDGKETDYTDIVSLSYGTHEVRLQANHYQAYTATITVNKDYETIVIDMTASSTTSTTSSGSSATTSPTAGTSSGENTPTAPTVTAPSTSTNLTAGYSVNVTTPEGGTLYVDGVYIGTIPCSFDKSSGNKTVTITRNGFTTISYTISIANAIGDVSYAFPDLVESK